VQGRFRYSARDLLILELMLLRRIDIKSSEIAAILGVSENTARGYIRDMRIAFQKKDRHKITIVEFCSYFDLPHNVVYCQINGLKLSEYDWVCEGMG
jgi:hypothetical protein